MLAIFDTSCIDKINEEPHLLNILWIALILIEFHSCDNNEYKITIEAV